MAAAATAPPPASSGAHGRRARPRRRRRRRARRAGRGQAAADADRAADAGARRRRRRRRSPIAARTTDPATDAPFPVLALAILAGLFALAGLVVALARWRGWEPAWADDFRHAAGEAGWRASSTWAEFTDFVRFGR